MSFSETVFLFVLALIIFGPKKLPEIARQVGKYMNEFRRASNEFKAQIEQEVRLLDVEERKQSVLPPSPVPEGTASRGLSGSGESKPVEAVMSAPAAAPADSAAITSEDEPLFAMAGKTKISPADGADPAPAATPASQESHG